MYGIRTTKRVGEFEVGPKMFVSDPCYERTENTNRSSAVIEVVPGKWESKIDISDEGTWGNRVAELRAWEKESFDDGYMNSWNWEFYSSCGVDSGQLGFFDFDKYPIGVNGYSAEYDDPDNWYKKACNETCDEKDRSKRSGIVEGMGVNASSGFGDGEYEIFVARNNDDKVVAVKAVFIPDNDGEDDYD